MASEQEEFEFRARLEKETAGPKRRSPMEMVQHYAGLAGRGAVEGLVKGAEQFIPPIYPRESVGSKLISKIDPGVEKGLTKLGLPEAETGVDKAVQLGGELGPSLLAGSKTVGPQAATALQDIGKSLMHRALKPTLGSQKRGDAAIAIDTMLDKGLNVTKGGVNKLRDEIDKLNDQIKDKIASSTAMVDKAQVGKHLNDLMTKFRNQVNPAADEAAIKKAWDEFKNHPAWGGLMDMPVQVAQKLKQGTYDQLRKKYGQMGSAEVESQKALARGLKDEISAKVPDVAGLNAEESKLIKTLNVAERQVMIDANKNPAGLAWLTHSPAQFAAFVADRSPLFKSLLARLMYRSATPLSKVTGAGMGAAVYELGNKAREQPEP
jgi:hypothetical protein